MIVVFLLAVLFCLYTYVGFPLWLYWRARDVADAPVQPLPEEALPRVSILIAAHNERQNLPAKFDSLAALDYPCEQLEVLLVSDGSTDGSNAYCEDYFDARPGWHFIEQMPAAGKPTALNRAASKASGDILVFMDARQPVSPGSVRALVTRLAAPGVGAVSGELVLATDSGEQAADVGLYWRYERWIRDTESRLFSTTGATGALYAIRREHFKTLPADTLLDDFDTPVSILRLGLRTVFEPAARVFDQAESSGHGEFRRKARTLAGNFQSFQRHPWLFSPAKNPVWWQFLSHKVFRLLVPVAMLLALLASLFGHGWFLDTMFWLQTGFYAVGIWGMTGRSNRLASVIAVFLQLNAAAVVGAWRAWRGTAAVRWRQA